MYRTALAIAATALLGASCRPTEEPSPAEPERVVRIERTECYGTCPAYTLELWSDGRVAFEGVDYVEALGPRETAVSTETVAAVLARAESAGFGSWSDAFTNVIDAPYLFLTVRLEDGREPTVMVCDMEIDLQAWLDDGLEIDRDEWETTRATRDLAGWIEGALGADVWIGDS